MNTELKWTISGVVFLIVFTLGCYLWYHWETEPYRQDYAKTQQLIQEWTAPVQTVETDQALGGVDAQVVDPAEQKPLSVEKSADKTNTPIADVNRVKINRLAPEQTEPVRLSPNGLGAYPDIPEGCPYRFDEEDSIEHELITRVQIELFKQGTYTYGASMSGATGLVYPITKDAIYVEWGTVNIPGRGDVRYISRLTTHPEIGDQIRKSARSRKIPNRRRSPMLEDDIPPGITVLNHSDGIAPYDFLNLQR